MPLRLVKRAGSDHWYVRGTVRKQSVFESTGTDNKKAAEAIRIKREARLLADSIHGKESSITFFESAVAYMAAGGSARFLGEEVDGKWTRLLGHFGMKVLRTITQDDLDAAAEKLYPNTQYDTRNRQCYTPFIAVWNHALPDNPRKWKRPKKPKGTTVVRLKPIRAGTKPVAYERAAQFVLEMSPANAMVMTALFYTGMRPIELFVLSDAMVNVPGQWITLENTKISVWLGNALFLHTFQVVPSAPTRTPMNETERAALVCEQYASGVDNGRDTVNIIIKKFPDGFPKAVSGEVRKIIDAAKAHVVNAFVAGGVERKYIDPFAEGFNVGVRNRVSEHVSECALRTNQNYGG